MIPTCPHEEEVFTAVAQGRWPETVSQELKTHVMMCVVCGDVAMVSDAIMTDARALHQAADVPPATLVWHRAHLRRRLEAQNRVERPITVVQVAMAGAVMGVLGTAVGATSERVQGWVSMMREWLAETPGMTPVVMQAVDSPWFIGVVVAMLVWVATIPVTWLSSNAEDH